MQRTDKGARIFATAERKWNAVVGSAKASVRQGRAVLIGTRSVSASEHVGQLLSCAGLNPFILNARQDQREAEIVASAGEAGRVTVATNMAGRGTDIKLHRTVQEAGGLHVILTEYHEARRIDRQLFGRAGRQGDPGSYEALVALDDELFQRFAGQQLLSALSKAIPKDTDVPRVVGRILRARSQAAAERLHARIRRANLAEDQRLEASLAFAGAE